MKVFLTILASVAAGPALAHGVHVAGAGGHDHIVAILALGVAGFAAIFGLIRGKAA